MSFIQSSVSFGQVETTAHRQLQQILEGREGGLIAISGPTGAGKTSLVLSGMMRLREKLSASVLITDSTGEPKEFLLDLFTALCRAVADAPRIAGIQDFDDLRRVVPSNVGRTRANQVLPVLWPSLMVSGLALIVLSALDITLDPKAVWGAVFLAVGVILGIYNQVLRPLQRAGRRPRGSGDEGKQVPEQLRELATDLLHQITLERRYQQSYTSGSSFGLKLPVGIEAGTSGSVTLTQLQWQLSDISSLYRRFVDQLITYGGVVIAIDNFDRSVSSEKAYELLREVQPTLRQDGCHYMVCMSNEMLGQLEDQGFSFDFIVTVGHISYLEAAQLLKSRVIGLPEPFLHLCYCLSGGQMRQLRQTTGSLMRQSQDAGAPSLAVACTLTLQPELEDRIDRALRKAEISGPGAQSSSAVAWCSQLETIGLSSHDLINHCQGLDRVGLLAESDVEEASRARQRLGLLRGLAELAAFTYYCATVLQLTEAFEANRNDSASMRAKLFELLDEMADARRVLFTQPRLSWQAVSNVRTKMGELVLGIQRL